MIPVIGRDRLHLGPEGVGLLATMDGIGAFVGALLVALWLIPSWYGRTFVCGIICYLITVVVFYTAIVMGRAAIKGHREHRAQGATAPLAAS